MESNRYEWAVARSRLSGFGGSLVRTGITMSAAGIGVAVDGVRKPATDVPTMQGAFPAWSPPV